MTPTPMHSKLLLPLLAVASVLPAQTIISVDAAHPGPAIAPTMFGIFFEDINFGADGGLYPELIKNRSFEFTDPLTAWAKIEVLEPRRRANSTFVPKTR